jgi:protein-tyrosine-phosphatase
MKVLFICKGNWMRSQIAAALYNHVTKTQDADSVGTYVGAPEEPEGRALSYIPEFLKSNPGVIWWDVENPNIVDQGTAERIYRGIERLVVNLLNENKRPTGIFQREIMLV